MNERSWSLVTATTAGGITTASLQHHYSSVAWTCNGTRGKGGVHGPRGFPAGLPCLARAHVRAKITAKTALSEQPMALHAARSSHGALLCIVQYYASALLRIVQCYAYAWLHICIATHRAVVPFSLTSRCSDTECCVADHARVYLIQAPMASCALHHRCTRKCQRRPADDPAACAARLDVIG